MESLIKPKVSVLMTVYNGALYLSEALESVLNQSYQNWELVIVNNFSNDSSLDIIKSYSDPRIRLISFTKNMGRVYALRHAFEISSGDFLAVLDADDIARKDRFDKQVNFLNKRPEVSLVASWTRLIDGSGNLIGKFTPPNDPSGIHKTLAWANIITHSSVMFRKDQALKFGGYSERFIWGHDFSLILSMAQISSIAIIDEFLCDLRITKSSMTKSDEYQLIVASENIQLFKKASLVLSLDADAAKKNKVAIAVAEIKYGIALIKTNSILKGLALIFSRVIFTPSVLWRNGPVRRLLGGNF